MIKKYGKTADFVEYKAILFDGSNECIELIMEMCDSKECIQNIDNKNVLIGTYDGVSIANVGDYLVCGNGDCVHPVSEEYFKDNYFECSI